MARSSTDLGAIGMPLTVSAQLRFELDELIDEVEPNGIVCPARTEPATAAEPWDAELPGWADEFVLEKATAD